MRARRPRSDVIVSEESVHGRIFPCYALFFAMLFRVESHLAAPRNAQTHAIDGDEIFAP